MGWREPKTPVQKPACMYTTHGRSWHIYIHPRSSHAPPSLWPHQSRKRNPHIGHVISMDWWPSPIRACICIYIYKWQKLIKNFRPWQNQTKPCRYAGATALGRGWSVNKYFIYYKMCASTNDINKCSIISMWMNSVKAALWARKKTPGEYWILSISQDKPGKKQRWNRRNNCLVDDRRGSQIMHNQT